MSVESASTTEGAERRRPAAGDELATTAPASYHRSPRALGRLVLLALLAAVALLVRELMDRTVDGLERDLVEAVRHLPGTTGAILDAAAVAVAFIAVAAAVIQCAIRGAWRGAAVVVVAFVGGFGLARVVGAFTTIEWVPSAAPDRWVSEVIFGAAAALIVVGVFASHRRYRAATALFAVLAIAGGAWGEASLLGRLTLLSIGGAVGAAIALALGTPGRRAVQSALLDALADRGLEVAELERHGGDARASVPWAVTTTSGSKLFVKTYNDEERSADLLFRMWRRLRLRRSGDQRPHASLRDAVEHEAFAAMRASSAGVPVPRVVGMGAMSDGGVYLLFEDLGGRSLDRVVEDDGADAISDTTLREAWSMVRTIHRAGIAHRDLRAANLVVDGDGGLWMVDFAFADLFAGDGLRARDLVEMLASMAALVGPDRAVESAVTTLGHVAWEDALRFVQPLAVSNATRQALGRAGFKDLRARLATAVQAPEPDLPRLGRVDLRTIISLVVVGAAVWALLPQISGSGDLWEQIPRADRTLLGLAAVASLFTYVGASLSIKGSVADHLPPLRTFVAQLASSFTNRVTPAKVGGLALNVRWLVKEGVETSAAAAAVSVNAVGGLIVHVVLTVFVVIWAGRVGLGKISLPSGRSILTVVGVIGAVMLAMWLLPPLRELLQRRVLPRARQSLSAVAEVASQPSRLAMLFGGSVVVSACYITALSLSLRAMDSPVAVSTVALVYLAGSALATAAPTPGGLGATEAVFVAAFASLGVEQGVAVPAVLLYRLVTFWLPIVPGWLAFTYLQRADRI